MPYSEIVNCCAGATDRGRQHDLTDQLGNQGGSPTAASSYLQPGDIVHTTTRKVDGNLDLGEQVNRPSRPDGRMRQGTACSPKSILIGDGNIKDFTGSAKK